LGTILLVWTKQFHFTGPIPMLFFFIFLISKFLTEGRGYPLVWTNFMKPFWTWFLWNSFFFLWKPYIPWCLRHVHVFTFGKDNYCALNINIPKCNFFNIVKIHCKNVPLKIPPMFFLVHLEFFYPRGHSWFGYQKGWSNKKKDCKRLF
jgi:hypothetical protein